MKRTTCGLVVAMFLGCLCSPASAKTPSVLSYQGYLTDSVGNPVTGDWTMTFSFYTSLVGGEPFFETSKDVTTDLGLFTVLLGEEPGNPLAVATFAEGDLYLQLTIETEIGPVVLDPRQRVVSSAYSVYSARADECGEATNAMTLGGAGADAYVTLEQIPQVCITPENLEEQLVALGYAPGAQYGDEDVAAFLLAEGYSPCACYGDDSVAAYLLVMGYVPGPHFSGLYGDLQGTPDLDGLVQEDDLLTLLSTSGAVLMSDGSVELQGDLDFAGMQALNLAVHNSDQAPDQPSAGQLWWDTGDKQLKVYNGQQWAFIGTGSASDLACDGCVDSDDVSFGYAASDGKNGAALNALNVDCAGCVNASEVSFAWAKGVLPGGDAEHALMADNAANVTCAGCVQAAEIDPAALNAKFIAFADDVTNLGANSVQGAIEKLADGGLGGQFTEGNGTIVPYVEQWGLPAYGEAQTFVHMMNPSNPKVVMHLYAGESTSFASSSNLVVAYDFAPNQYSAGAIGVLGETALQVLNPSIFNNGSHIMILQTMAGSGTNAGDWEINQVTAVNGTTLQLLKPLTRNYKTDATAKAQVVLAASFGQVEIVNGGTLRPSQELAADGSSGGVVYIRANKVTVKSGGAINADGAGFKGGAKGAPAHHGSSECKSGPLASDGDFNCSGGGGQDKFCAGSGGGGNKTAGEDGVQTGNCTGAGKGGQAKGDAGLATLNFGGGGGSTMLSNGGTGGGIVVIGAQQFIVQDGGKVSAAGTAGDGPGAGGGAGGTMAVFSDLYQVEGDVSVAGGDGGMGEGWQFINPLSLGSVSFETYSHGGGFSPKYDEFWYPHWSGSTIHRYSREYQHLGQFSSGNSDMMQLWGDVDGTYYTANWGQDRVRKWTDKGAQQLWEVNVGSTAGGVCHDGEYVYAMRNSGATVWKIHPTTGQVLSTFDLPSIPNGIHGGLACIYGRLYYGVGSTVYMYDLANKQQVGTFGVAATIYNLAFDGSVMYISANSSTVHRYQLVNGNVYQPSSGGTGGDGWEVHTAPLQGIINESYPKGVAIWIDGQDITGQVGDPNSKGDPMWDAAEQKWGSDGLNGWNTGPLDLTSVVPWTLGEHTVEIKETGGAGGDVKMFLYVIYTFSKSIPPANDTCNAPIMLELSQPVTVSGTTEDIMGKTKATDANIGPFCGGSQGPDVVYGFNLADWRQLTVETTCAFSPKVYIKKGTCADGELVACGEETLKTGSLEPGTYYLFVDGDGNLQKGDFTLKVSATEPGPPQNDSCINAAPLVFDGGTAQASGMTLFSNDFHQAVCGGAGAPENVYSFTVPPGIVSLNISLDADFAPAIYIAKEQCGASPIACIPSNSYQMGWPGQGTYYLFVDGKAAGSKGLYTLTVTME